MHVCCSIKCFNYDVSFGEWVKGGERRVYHFDKINKFLINQDLSNISSCSIQKCMTCNLLGTKPRVLPENAYMHEITLRYCTVKKTW